MKKYIIVSLSVFLILSLILVGCNNSNDKKARRVIKEYLKSSMNDFSSYEPVEFSSLDSTFSTFFDTEEGRMIHENLLKAQNGRLESYEMMYKYEYNPLMLEIFKESYIELEKRADSLFMLESEARHLFKPSHNGYEMSHKYRGKNDHGAIMLNDIVFFIDKDITKVNNVEDKETYENLKIEIQRLDSMRNLAYEQLKETNKMDGGNSN